jgi:hypothetical protein
MGITVHLTNFLLLSIYQMGNNNMHMHRESEKGLVSILSVVFFILLMSVLTISFLRIMSDEQDQVVDDDLSKSALASAESGVEDGKRALAYCRGLAAGAARTACYQALQNQNCPGIFAGTIQATGAPNPIPAALGLDQSAGDGSVRVGNVANNQRYTCVTLATTTNTVVGQAGEGLGDLIPLSGTGDYNQVSVWWHQNSIDGTVSIPAASDAGRNYRYDQWENASGTRFVPMLRIQILEFTRGETFTNMANNTVGLYAVPTSSGGVSTMNFPGIDAGAWAGSDKRIEVTCNTAAATSRGYLCGLTMGVPTNTPGDNKDYYMVVKSVYGSPHYMVDIAQNGTRTTFNDVQPEIDSTGAAADVFRRVITRVAYGSEDFITTNTIEAGTSLCKDFFVTDLDAASACLGL